MNRLFTIVLFAAFVFPAFGQSLDDLVFENQNEKSEFVSADFKTTSVVNFHTVRGPAQKELLFSVKHRFANVSSGLYDFYGMDIVQSARIGFEYGVFDNLSLGIGRSTREKAFDGFVKYRFISQQTGKSDIPVSVALVAGTDIKTNRWKEEDVEYPQGSGMSYFYQLILARKCSERLSLQFLPTLVHQNLVKLNADPNDTFAAGISGRYKISARATFNAEYFYIVNPPESVNFKNPLSLGFSFDTGGHIFQINFSNAPAMTERHALTQTAGSWMDGDFALGFSIYRTFSF